MRLPIRWGLLFVALALAGCGDGKPKTFPLAGSVTIGPAPLASGVIRLTPDGGGVPSAGTVRDGKYAIDAVLPGKYAASFEATRPSPPIGQKMSSDVRDVGANQPLPEIPEKYRLGVPVEVTKAEPALNFDLSK